MRRKPSNIERASIITGILIASFSLKVFAAPSAEIEKARALTVGCLGCHGAHYEGQGGLPPLSTLDRETFIQRFEAYRRMAPTPSVMHRIAQNYSPEEIRLMADLIAKGSPP
ncbi:MAG: hypothetical protein RLZ25_1248 [Pseudomonadota bacterium]|jgi:cytochrome c553